ncbi:MAG TPA: DNA primase, partial [Microbacterium sp.]|nr:DNA primase [Microbacterium sp.]
SHAPARRETAATASDGAPAAPVIEAVTIASLPRTADVALERDAVIGILQYGHQVDAELLGRALAQPFRNPALEAVRQAIVDGDWTKPGWVMDAVNSVREPYRSLAGELLMTSFPARDESGAVASTTDLARRLIVRGLEQEKQELLGAVQRVPAESDGGRALRVRLRDIDLERRRFTES